MGERDLRRRVLVARVDTSDPWKGSAMRALIAGIAATLLALIGAGCGDDDVTRIDAEQAGEIVELAVDEILEVRLEANPTTGFEWVVLDAGILELVSEEHKPDSDADGSGGITTLTFSPTGTGSAALELVYLQPFRDDPEPIASLTVTVAVTE
jgi:inhibitor of cysteine peptidase